MHVGKSTSVKGPWIVPEAQTAATAAPKLTLGQLLVSEWAKFVVFPVTVAFIIPSTAIPVSTRAATAWVELFRIYRRFRELNHFRTTLAFRLRGYGS